MKDSSIYQLKFPELILHFETLYSTLKTHLSTSPLLVALNCLLWPIRQTNCAVLANL